MPTLVLDPDVDERIRAERRASGGDRYDEVWDGVYVMSPLANNEHQGLAAGLAAVLQIVLGFGEGGLVYAGVNVSDQEKNWEHNYRCPDVAVFLPGTAARDRGTYWLGGPDFAVEITSRGDKSRAKLPFYASVGTRELLLIDRAPVWTLELYRLQDGALSLAGTARVGDPRAPRQRRRAAALPPRRRRGPAAGRGRAGRGGRVVVPLRMATTACPQTIPGHGGHYPMATLVLDPYVDERIRAERRASGGDRYDEVWDGVYVMSPLANDEHQDLVMGIAFVLHTVIGLPGLGVVRPGVNVSDREEDWEHNYRCPDVAVFLRDTAAQNRGTYWLGGPDFAVEITSRGDKSRAKLPFYAGVGTRELLLIDRAPVWTLELYRLQGGALSLAGTARVGDPEPLGSAVVPLRFRLVAGAGRPRVEVARAEGGESWSL